MARYVSMAGLDFASIDWSDLPPPPAAPATRARTEESKRSDLPCPRIIFDRVEYKSMQTGEMITSRAQHREHLRKHGLVELGNETRKLPSKEVKAAKEKKERQKDLKQAFEMFQQGYRAPKAQSAEAVGIDLGSAPIQNGTKIRTNVKAETPSIIL